MLLHVESHIEVAARQCQNQCLSACLIKMKVKAPEGYHWMKKGSTYKLMKDPRDGYKPHKGASKEANFEIQKVHKK